MRLWDDQIENANFPAESAHVHNALGEGMALESNECRCQIPAAPQGVSLSPYTPPMHFVKLQLTSQEIMIEATGQATYPDAALLGLGAPVPVE